MNKALIGIIIFVIACLLLIALFTLFSNKEVDMKDKKVLIAYYSYSGNTRAAAEKNSVGNRRRSV